MGGLQTAQLRDNDVGKLMYYKDEFGLEVNIPALPHESVIETKWFKGEKLRSRKSAEMPENTGS